MRGIRFTLRMAWREGRGEGMRRLSLVSGAVIAGVAALVAINSFTENLRTSVAEQARALLGADLTVRSTRPLPAAVNSWLDSLTTPTGGGRALVTGFVAMGYVPRTAGVRFVQVRGVEPGYPFYGEITTEPAGLWASLTRSGGALVDPVLLTALGAEIGDSLALGQARFPIVGTVKNVPGEVGVTTAFGARVFIPAERVAATGLVRFGSRAEYEMFVRLPPGQNARDIARRYRPSLRDQRIGIRTVEEDQENLTEAFTRLGNYLGLVALVALLLGGLGVASAVHVLIKRKLDTIAVLRCLGAGARRVSGIYLLLAGGVVAIGSMVGALVGVLVQQLLPLLFRGLLPVDVRVIPSPASIALGTGLGLWVALVFALIPLLGVRRISPLRTLRRDVEPIGKGDPLARLALLIVAASVVALTTLQVGSLPEGVGFSIAGGIALLLLWLAARILIGALRRWFPTRLPYLWRQGLANLYRPANQTVIVVLSLGFGAFILTTLFLAQHNLLREFRPGSGFTQPNLMLFDIQPAQAVGVTSLLQADGLEPAPLVPIVTMRIKAIRGVPANQLMPPPDTTPPSQRSGRRTPPPPGTPAGWALRREYRSTYRDSLTSGEAIVAGDWWKSGFVASGEPGLISLEEDLAADLTAKVGDEITWDVQGVEIRTRVGNLRSVDWRRFEPNFFVVFQSGVLDSVPRMLVTLVRVDSTGARARVQRRVAEQFPNVTILDLSQIQEALEKILDRGAVIVRFLALFSLVTGMVVLVGSVAASRLSRIREAVLLKTLGATRRQVLRILVAEYAALGLLATLISIGLASVAGWALFRWVFDSSFQLPLGELGALTALLVGLTLLLGLWNSAEVLKRTPLAVLREE